jgi:uncharacterized protein
MLDAVRTAGGTERNRRDRRQKVREPMSAAANPSYDVDALHRAQRAYEPSMEEILASIRNIISEDRPGLGHLAAPTQAPVAEASPPAPATEQQAALEKVQAALGPRVVWPNQEAEAAPPPLPASAPEPVAPRQDARRPVAAPASEDPLISPEANAAITHSFDTLSVSMAVQNSTIVQDTVREMIRPMLKAWLDDHLPSMVENLVRAEIQRVARGGR